WCECFMSCNAARLSTSLPSKASAIVRSMPSAPSWKNRRGFRGRGRRLGTRVSSGDVVSRMKCCLTRRLPPAVLSAGLLLLGNACSSAFDFSSPLPDVLVTLNGTVVGYQVTDPARGLKAESVNTPGVVNTPDPSGGVVAWVAGSTVYYRIYDPVRGAW